MGISISLYEKEVSSDEYVEDFYLGSVTGIALTFDRQLRAQTPLLASLIEAAYGEDIPAITGSQIEGLLSEIRLILPILRDRNFIVVAAFERLLAFLESKDLKQWELSIS